MGRPELLKVKKGSVYEYADVYPLLYLKMKLEGLQSFSRLHQALSNGENGIHLLDGKSVSFGEGIVVTSAHLAKGLEFDHVIVPFGSRNNYNTEPDRQMLYIACTRAMHCLEFSYTGSITPFLEN